MSQNPMELLAELREDMRRVKRAIDRILDASGNVRATSVATTPIHSHSGGNQGGPLNSAKVENFVDVKEQGSAPGNPSAGYIRFYARSGRLYSKDSAGTESGPL